MTPPTEHALIAVDWRGIPLILTTDGAAVALMVDQVSNSAEDVGLVDGSAAAVCPTPGLYLWTGVARTQVDNTPDGYERETVFDGTCRPVRADEVGGLFAMRPPDDDAWTANGISREFEV